MTDQEIVGLILGGDREIYRILVEKYQYMIFNTCMGFLHNREDAEDVAQEVFIRAYRSMPGFKGDASFSTWIYRIAVNASLNRKRKSEKDYLIRYSDRMSEKVKERDSPPDVPEKENPENILIRKESEIILQKALDSLPEKQRIAIVLSKYDELSQREIAEVMSITEGAVENLLQRAKKNLRQKLLSLKK